MNKLLTINVLYLDGASEENGYVRNADMVNLETQPLYSVLTSVPEEEEEDLTSYQAPHFNPANRDTYNPYPQYPWSECQPTYECSYFEPMHPANTFLTPSSHYINSQYGPESGYHHLNNTAPCYEQGHPDYFVDNPHVDGAASSIPTSLYYRTIPARPSYRNKSSTEDSNKGNAVKNIASNSTRRCMTPSATLDEFDDSHAKATPASHHLYGEMSMAETRRIINDIDQLIEH